MLVHYMLNLRGYLSCNLNTRINFPRTDVNSRFTELLVFAFWLQFERTESKCTKLQIFDGFMQFTFTEKLAYKTVIVASLLYHTPLNPIGTCTKHFFLEQYCNSGVMALWHDILSSLPRAHICSRGRVIGLSFFPKWNNQKGLSTAEMWE